ncbi:MAG: WYL domain-containing protein [Treponema sp.]|nr:WYL domain-containing protein [Treponema sp.]
MDWEPGAAYRIQYVSESGRRSVRTIEVREIRRRNGVLYLRAWCRLRGEERTFRSDRVLSAEALAVPAPGFASAAAWSECSRWMETNPLPEYAYWSPRPAGPAAAGPRTPAPAVLASIPRAAPETTVSIDGSPPHDPARPEPGDAARSLGTVFRVILALAFFGAMASNLMSKQGSPAPFAYPGKAPAAVVPAPKPSPPRPAVEEAVVAGRLLRTVRSGALERYEVPSLGLVTFNKLEAIAAIRVPNFRAATGLADRALEARYLAADLNRSGRLAFEELQAFQEKTWREFRYEPNEPALRPDQFLAAGGGDCEDFALYTAGLLRFWGWEPYLGILAPSRHGSTGHAVCLSYEEGSFPGSYTWFQVEAWTTPDGVTLKPGRYVPIDYDHVGGLSNAVSPGWKLQEIYVPESAWGQRM